MRKNAYRKSRFKLLCWVPAALLLALAWVALGSLSAQAALSPAAAISEPDANCLMCHSDPDFKGTFENGEMISLYVDRGEYEQSVHGPAGLNCVACHTGINRYPHHAQEQVTCVSCHGEEGGMDETAYETLRVRLSYSSQRAMTIDINEECRSCHKQEFEVAVDSAHVRVMEGGNPDAPLCVDCHGSHAIIHLGEPRGKISEMCGTCHTAVYSTYRTSVHGAALAQESNPDVPTCIECHGVHSVRGPRDASYRNDSITICGECHSNDEMMAKYGLSTDVFRTYLDDFHGRTVEFYRQYDIGSQSNKAVCFDCHGIHNIRQADDPLATVYPNNLQHTCQQCHEDASIQFPAAWLSHSVASWEKTPALHVVNSVYTAVIPLTIGGFMVYIGLDARRRWKDKQQILRQALAEEEKNDYFDLDI